jgi:hypothetical protein
MRARVHGRSTSACVFAILANDCYGFFQKIYISALIFLNYKNQIKFDYNVPSEINISDEGGSRGPVTLSGLKIRQGEGTRHQVSH